MAKETGGLEFPARIDTAEMEEDTNVCNELLKSLVKTATGVYEKIHGLFSNMIKPPSKDALDAVVPTTDDAKRLEDMRAQLEELGKKKDIAPEFRRVNEQAEELEKKLAELQKKRDIEVAGDNDADRLKYLDKEIERTTRSLETLRAQGDAMKRDGTAYIDPRTTEEYKALAAAIRNAEEEMGRAPATDTIEAESAELREAERTAQRLTIEMNRLGAASEQGFRNPEQVLRFSANVREAEQSIQNAREQLEALAEQQIPTEDYAGLTKAIELSDQALAKLYQKREQLRGEGLGEESAKWQKLAA